MKMRTKFKFYSDPSHGWLNVRKSELEKLGIADKISNYSYMRGTHAFLEEDSDAPKFIEAIKAVGITPTFKTHTNAKRPSKIRKYQSYVYVAPNPVIEAKVAEELAKPASDTGFFVLPDQENT